MTLEIQERIRIANELRDEYVIRRLKAANAELEATIDFIATDFPEITIRKAWLENQPHKPVVSRGLLRLVGVTLMVAAVVLTVVLSR